MLQKNPPATKAAIPVYQYFVMQCTNDCDRFAPLRREIEAGYFPVKTEPGVSGLLTSATAIFFFRVLCMCLGCHSMWVLLLFCGQSQPIESDLCILPGM